MAEEKLTIKIDADNKASRALRRLNGQLNDLGNVGRRAGRMLAGGLAAATAAATAAVGAFTKSVIAVGSESEQARIRLDSLFGSAEEGAAAFDAVREAAGRLPFTFSEILGISSTLGVISDDAGELQTRIMQAAEISARFGISLQDTASNMVRFFTAGANSADLFRERGVLAALGVQAGMKISAQESARLWRLHFEQIEKEGTSATDRLAKSWQGSVSMLEDQWREFRQTVSDEGLLDAFKEIVRRIREQMRQFIESGAAQRFARSFADMMTRVLSTLSDAIFTMIGAIGTDSGEAFRNLGIVLGSRLGQGLFLGLEKVLREANLLSQIPGPVGELFDKINLAALGAEQLANLARDSAEEATEALRILADAGGRVEDLGEKLQADLTGGGGGAGGAGGGAGTPGPTEPAVVDAFLRSFGIPSVEEVTQALNARFERLRRLGAAPVPLGMTREEAAFGPDPRAEGPQEEFVRRGGTGRELFGADSGAGEAGGKAGQEFTESMSSVMEDGGRMAVRSLIDGLIGGVDDFGDFAVNLFKSLFSRILTGGLFDALGIASPSTEARWAGQQVGLGLALGIEDSLSRVRRSMRSLAGVVNTDIAGPQMRALGATAASGPVEIGPRFDPSELQPLSRWAVANDPAFQSLLGAADQIGRQTGRVRER